LVLFTRRNYSIATLLAGLSFFATFGIGLVFTITMQSVLGMTPIEAGLTFLPMSILLALTAPQAGRLTDRFGGRTLLVAGPVLMAIGLAGTAVVTSLSATWATFVIPLACYGLGMGLVTAPSLTVAMNDVAPILAGSASGLFNTSRQVGGAIGVAVVGAILQNQLVSNLQAGAVAVATQVPRLSATNSLPGFLTLDEMDSRSVGASQAVCPYRRASRRQWRSRSSNWLTSSSSTHLSSRYGLRWPYPPS
jgi:MFS family permease